MKITYMLRDQGGCGMYRLVLPMTRLIKAGYEVRSITPGMAADTILKNLDADVVVIPRPCDEQMLGIMTALKAHGVKVVIDFDDDMFNIAPLSTHYGDFGTSEVIYETPDGPVEVWKDGHNINIKRNIETQGLIKECIATADLLTVTQPLLAEAYAPYAKNITCLPNCIDFEKWQKLPLQRKNETRLYWSGGASHYQDWLLVGEALETIMRTYHNVKLHIMGTFFRGPLKRIDPDRIVVHKWEDINAYPYKTAIIDADISLIPLEDSVFNRGKSNIKWVEQAALGIPSVTSNVSPYKEWDNGINGIFVENTTKAWIDGISLLIEDSILRAKMGGEAQHTVRQNNDIDRKYRMWAEAYQGIL